MAGFAGDAPFGIDLGIDFWDDDDNDNDAFGFDPFDDYGGDEYEGEGLIGGPVVDDGDGDGEEFCISGFALRDVDGDAIDVFVGEDHASQPSNEDPLLETLGRSFDSDGGFSDFFPHFGSALDASEAEEDELMAGDDRGGGGPELERGAVIEEAAVVDDDDDDGIGLMLSGFNLDPRPVVGGFQTLVDTDAEVISDDDMDEGPGGLMLSGFDHVAPRIVRPAWMVMGTGDTDATDADLVLFEMLAGRVGEDGRGLPASHAAVDGLPEVVLSEEEASHGCAVCKDGIAAGLTVLRLPCKHYFHADCIRPWLAIRNTCPVCRFELPTGDAEYDRRHCRTGVAPVAQQGASVQSGGTSAGSGATVAAGDAAECSGENRPKQGPS